MKVLIFATHPIQYQVPLYRELSKRIDLKVIYMLKQTKEGQAKAGFGVEFNWDVSLTDGYNYDYLRNYSAIPSSGTYKGILLKEKDIESLFKKEKPNAAIIHGWFPKGMKQIINYTHKNNIISFCRGDSTLLMTNNPIKKILKEFYIKNILKKINYFLYVGKENKRYYEYYGVKKNRLFPALHCINTPFFQSYYLKKSAAKQNNKINIGFAGKFIEKKQPNIILEAINNSKHKEKISVHLIGDGPLKKKLIEYSKKNSLNLNHHGFLNQTEIVEKGYSCLDLLILPSKHNETWGLVVNEVMTGGIPCIVSNKVGCHSDLIIEKETGYVFNYNSTSDLTNKIDQFIESKLNGKDFKSSVLNKIYEYSLDKTVEGYLSALRIIN